MIAFTVVYIQLTASQVGAKYLKRDLIVMSKCTCNPCTHGLDDYCKYSDDNKSKLIHDMRKALVQIQIEGGLSVARHKSIGELIDRVNSYE
tara:strand:- start:23840 stop:24112 length:273 start_codon:yes stop_codon:yes gene_type:complete